MMIEWIAYSLLTGVLVSGAALAAEWWLRTSGRSVRWVWVGAVAVTLLLPFVAWLTGGRFPGGWLRGVEASLPVQVLGLAPGGAADVGGPGNLARLRSWVSSDAVVGGAWLLATLVAALWYAFVWRRLRRSSRTWRRARVAGRAVLVSRHGGPAAVGLLHPSIVVPEWLLGASEDAQRVVLLHESEHVRTRDHALLALAPVPVILFPWNVALWWQLRRLRLAIELDCDRRVLAYGVDVERYASLLLEIAVRPRGHVLAAGLARPERRPLERRLLEMTRGPLPWRRVRAFGSFCLAGLLLAVACEADPPLVAPSDTEVAAPSPAPAFRLRSDPMSSLAREVEAGHVVVFVNGEWIDPSRLAELEVGDIASIEVVKGPFAAVGPRVDGRVDIRLKRLQAGDLEASAPALRGARAAGAAAGTRLEALPEDAVWRIDGREATKEEANALPASSIARVEVVRLRRGPSMTSEIRIFRKDGGGAR
ncbi:MAG: M56 family metallopeptidase [Gemmatimonadota bacterium]|jgi:hypothetical protein